MAESKFQSNLSKKSCFSKWLLVLMRYTLKYQTSLLDILSQLLKVCYWEHCSQTQVQMPVSLQ